jgi:hypothetical protein
VGGRRSCSAGTGSKEYNDCIQCQALLPLIIGQREHSDRQHSAAGSELKSIICKW